MPFSQAPVNDTYSTKRIPCASDLDLRPNSTYLNGTTAMQDAGMVNLIPVKRTDDDQAVEAITRQPIHAYQVVNSNLINRGCYVWEKSVGTTYYFTVNGTGVYSSTDGVTWSLVNTLSTSATTPVRFTEYIDDVATKKLILVDGIEGYIFTSNAAGTKITDVNFPSPHVPFPVFMDGYLFLAKAGTADVYNSNLNDPATWTPGDFLSSELYPDDIQAMVKINNYILVIGTQGCEYMYDAANPTGSPLARYDGGSFGFGTQLPNSVAYNKNSCMFIANNNDGENTIKYVENFDAKDIPSNSIVPILNVRLDAASNPTNAQAVRGYFFRQFGKLFYGLALQGDVASPNILNSTWVYDFQTQWWTEFRIGASGDNPFPVYFTAASNSGNIATYVSGQYGNSPFFGVMEEGAKSPFAATAVDKIVNGPAESNIYIEGRTKSYDFGTMNLKFMYRLGMTLTENTSTTSTSGSTITMNLYWTDNDYATYSDVRQLVFGANLQWPFFTQLGSFRKRAFKYTYSDTKFLRISFIECDINKGQQ